MISKLLKNINVLFGACCRLVFKNFRFVFNFFIFGNLILFFYSYTNLFIVMPILLFIFSYYFFYMFGFKNMNRDSVFTDLEKINYFFFIFFGTIGFLSVYFCNKLLFPTTDSIFVLFIWYLYVLIFIFKNKNKNIYFYFIFINFFCFSFVSFIMLLFAVKNFDIIIHHEFFKFLAINDFYYPSQLNDGSNGWLTYLNKRLDKWSTRSPNFFSSMFEIYDLSTRYMRLNYFGLSNAFFLFTNTQIGSLLSFILMLTIFYFSLRVIFFKYIFTSFQYVFSFKKSNSFFVKINEYAYYTISLICVCVSLPFFFKICFIEFFSVKAGITDIFNVIIFNRILPAFDIIILKYEENIEEDLDGIKDGTWIPFTSWLIVWSQVGLFLLNPWIWTFLYYIFNTTYIFDFDEESYSRPSGKYYNFWKFLKRSGGKIPQFLLPWRIAKRSWYTWFEDERDYYVTMRWLPEYYHYLNQDALDYFEGTHYLKVSRQNLMHKLPLFFSTHLVFLREFESIWMDDLHFFYKVSDELDKNVAVQFFANLEILTPLFEAEGEKVRTTLEKLELDEGEEDEFIEAVEDLRFEDSLVAQTYFHNYSVIKYFDWINIVNKQYIKQIPDADSVSFYSKFWYSRFLRSQFGKAFITKPQYEHKKFLNNSYLLYFENNSTKNYYSFVSFFPVSSFSKLNYDFIPTFKVIPEYFYSYITSSMLGSSYFNHIIYTDKSVFLNNFKVVPAEVSKFCLNFEYFLVEFLIDNLFTDFCISYGFFQNDIFGMPDFGRAISSKFINFILSNGFLDLIYISFFEGIFFQEFFTIFFESFAFTLFDSTNYYNQLFSFFFKNIYYSNKYSIFENNFQFNDICLNGLLTFKHFDFRLFNFTWYELHNSNFPTENPSAPYKEFSINLTTMFFQSKKLVDFDLNSTFNNTSLEFKESNIFVLFREAYAENFGNQTNWFTDVLLPNKNNSMYFSDLFLDLFCSVAITYKFSSQLVKKSLNMNDVFFYLPTPKKLKIDLLTKQLDNLYGFAITSNEMSPKFMGFLDSDISFLGNLGNADSSYSDLSVTTSFEEYYNYLFFSDYRSFYSANFAVSKLYNSFIHSTNNFFYFPVFKPISYRKNRYFSNVMYASSPLLFSNVVFSKFNDFSTLHKFQLFDFWCLNYNFLFSSSISFTFFGMSKYKYQFFSDNKNAKIDFVSNKWYYTVPYSFKILKLIKIISFQYLKYYYFFSLLYKGFRACVYLFSKVSSVIYLGFQFRRLPFKQFKFQFYLSRETESNFDFNDRVFFF